MTNKEKVIDFMWKKTAFIYKKTNISMCGLDDFKDLEWNFTEDTCTSFITILGHAVDIEMDDGREITDADICPWCFVYNSHYDARCDECGYGMRNGICDSDQDLMDDVPMSVYENVTDKLGCKIHDEEKIRKMIVELISGSK